MGEPTVGGTVGSPNRRFLSKFESTLPWLYYQGLCPPSKMTTPVSLTTDESEMVEVMRKYFQHGVDDEMIRRACSNVRFYKVIYQIVKILPQTVVDRSYEALNDACETMRFCPPEDQSSAWELLAQAFVWIEITFPDAPIDMMRDIFEGHGEQ